MSKRSARERYGTAKVRLQEENRRLTERIRELELQLASIQGGANEVTNPEGQHDSDRLGTSSPRAPRRAGPTRAGDPIP